MKKEFWDWKPGFTGKKVLQMLIVLMMGQRTAVPPKLNPDYSFSTVSHPGVYVDLWSSALLFLKSGVLSMEATFTPTSVNQDSECSTKWEKS